MKTFLSSLFSIINTTFIYLVGGIDIAFKCLIIIIFVDYITGILSAIYNKKLSSKIGFKGILKKCVYICVVILATIGDTLVGTKGIARNLVIYFLISNDAISIIENAGKMGIKLPEKIKEYFEQLKINRRNYDNK